MATLNVKPLTLADLKTAKMVDMVAFYNRLTGKAILKFQDRATAVARCTKLIEHPPTKAPAEPPRVIKDTGPAIDPDANNYRKAANKNPLRQKLGKAEVENRPRSAKRDLTAVQTVMTERGVPSAMEMMARTITAPPRKVQSVDQSRKRGPKPKWPLESLVVLVEKNNPKRKDTLAHEEYELYRNCRTVKDYVDFGGQLAYMNYDEKRGFIKIVAPTAKRSAA